MQNLFKKLMPVIGISILSGIGCRKQDEIIIHPDTPSIPSNENAKLLAQ
jgi:hypothetical protein